ncbi:MBL fold metallo-hydrolase [Cyanobacterium stanieri LEGE 03274]|uniref:MBL fold metallo-hydrolase n=1 Tax=Cyanobacterium stanieri LEGE 03274 TaxID=1828756 RepID=A0ABR9V4V4_9CHRO|nr:MBL fold metallo-hydrolase [Cyanobacterium stanieri]MBE9222923.1 MBL fold metallo-hydrolase [Cyanobacterium stanieri LEGE 03274]
MASLTEKREENVSGNFYVDSSCIDCDTCRWMAKSTFSRFGQQSAVYHQPSNVQEKIKALQALLSCPTNSIGVVMSSDKIKEAEDTFPILVDENVYHCGYHSPKSFAAASYFIQREEGNILVDSPRFNPALVKKLEEMGGVRYMYLTHRDDIADHQKFHEYFKCDRLLHRDEITKETKNIEIPLDIDQPLQFTPDITIIPVPGHTQGHTIMLYKNKFFFTGDHLAWSDQLNTIIAFKNHCWYSWETLVKSTETLTEYSFSWLLPGHGRRHHASPEIMQQELRDCIRWMQTTI